MSYVRKISVKLFHHFRDRLSNTEKSIYLILAALLIVQVAQLVVQLIAENKYVFSVILGIIILALGLYLHLKRQRGVRNNHKLSDLEDQNNLTTNNNINTDGGNYNGVVEGNYIQGDYINIQDNRVDMSKDITSILNDFRVILTEMQSQGYNTKQAINQMAKELAEETRNKPYVKGKFHIDENADDSEVFQEFVRLLIQHKYLFNQTTGYEEENHGENINYERHTIYLESDKDDFWWYYKINGPLCNESGKCCSGKDWAIDEAKEKIDEARFSNW
ncbi:hypothetical protein [Microcoleus sp. CAWBG58]|uniref:hypothetical protein n=1 Tax=Microcoleus sp. CAWBG58 TaxID=2841651 RepID=UPI0025EC2AB0|nr:hypothetical protein [Microcoleus sp. CAWBG58]